MDPELGERLYRTMIRIRRFEETVGKQFYLGQVPGFVHLYIGEEAIAAGVCAALRPDDCISSTHRGHAHVLAKGGDPKLMMAEILGRETGYCKGKGGSMHIADMSQGILGTNGIVGGGVAIANGVGLALKMSGSDRISVAFLGDGAANQGVVWESLNLASIWDLPTIFVIENNGFGEWTRVEDVSCSVDFAGRTAGWNVPGISLDGNDVAAVYSAAENAVRRARAGHGPTLLDCRTFRWRGHDEGDEAFIGKWSYRTENELDEWKKRDPIANLAATLMDSGAVTREVLDHIDAQAIAEMEQAFVFAQQSPLPEPAQALEGVFST